MEKELIAVESPAELAREWRESEAPFVRKRRGIIGLSICSCTALAATALYQVGALRKLPQPASPRFSSKKVHLSDQAYSIFRAPDGLLGLVSYSLTAGLAAVGSDTRRRTHPIVPIAMGVKLLGDAAFASKLTADEFTKIRAFSAWSLLVTACTFGSLILGTAEVKAAVKRLFE